MKIRMRIMFWPEYVLGKEDPWKLDFFVEGESDYDFSLVPRTNLSSEKQAQDLFELEQALNGTAARVHLEVVK